MLVNGQTICDVCGEKTENPQQTAGKQLILKPKKAPEQIVLEKQGTTEDIDKTNRAYPLLLALIIGASVGIVVLGAVIALAVFDVI